MTNAHHKTGRSNPLSRVMSHKFGFALAFLAAFFVSYSALATLDLLPEAPAEEPARAEAVRTAEPTLGVTAPEDAERIVIEEIGLDVTIENPRSTSVAVLDDALLRGAVRYPESARLGEEGNVILMGHSSYLPVVNNKAFKAFNKIQDLEEGDRITVEGTEAAYVYAVTGVRHADAEEDAIPLTKQGHTLTLATCDSFGKKSDRFIVTAELVESYPLAS